MAPKKGRVYKLAVDTGEWSAILQLNTHSFIDRRLLLVREIYFAAEFRLICR